MGRKDIIFIMKKYFIKNEKIGILGAGSWGTTLGYILSKRHSIKIWEFDKNQYKKIIKDKENKKFLPEIILPNKIKFSNNIDQVIIDSNIIIVALPSHTIRENIRRCFT